MSTTTDKLKLFKYDVENDAKSTFDIEESLNNNWDKIDKFAQQHQFTPFCFNSGVVDARGKAACVTISNNTLTLLAGSVCTSAGGTTYTVPENISISIASLTAGVYNFAYDAVNQTIEKYGAVIAQPTQPANFSTGDIWLDNSVMPWSAKMKSSSGEIVAREIIPLPAKLDIPTVSDGGGGATLMPSEYNNNGLEPDYLPLTGGTVRGPLKIIDSHVPQFSIESSSTNSASQPSLYLFNKSYDINVKPTATTNLSLGRVRLFDKNQQDVGALQIYRDVVNNCTNRQMYVKGNGPNAANKSVSLSIGVNDDGTFRSSAPAVTNNGGIVTQTSMKKATNGYIKLGCGLIIQWGELKTTVDPGLVSVTLHTPFSGGYVVCMTSYMSDWFNEWGFGVESKTSSSFKAYVKTQKRAFMWLAIGFRKGAIMEEFYIGQIFEEIYPPEAAEWCNNRGDCYIDEIETVDEVRRFEIKAVSPPSEDEIRQAQIDKIKAQLTAIDLKTIRALRAGETEYLQQYEAQAVALRAQLNELGVTDVSELD